MPLLPEPDEELPPWLGERYRDTTHKLFRDADEASHDFEENE